ncbi:carotenoid oxygenase family protein [archaeon]|nr:MAG: carotenoid oxygenase family protein [archaeon]
MVTWVYVFVAILCSRCCLQLRHHSQYASKMKLYSLLPNGEDISDILTAWRRGFVNCKEEVCTELKGDLPADLTGTLYRNGYGKFTVGKETIAHPFDSDGMVTAITFERGKAFFRNRLVRTTGFMRERRARRILYRGVFGTLKQGFLANFLDLKLKNTANTHVAYWGEKLLALWEGGLPYRLEADSLRTIGEYRLEGLLTPTQALAAHYKVDPDKNTLVTISAKQTPPSGIELSVYELNTDYSVNTSRVFSVKGFGLFHDFALTKNYYIFTRCPLKIMPLPYVLGVKVRC